MFILYALLSFVTFVATVLFTVLTINVIKEGLGFVDSFGGFLARFLYILAVMFFIVATLFFCFLSLSSAVYTIQLIQEAF
jgi:hypothetical protein